MGTSASRAGNYALRGGGWTQAKRLVSGFAAGTGATVESAVGAFAAAVGESPSSAGRGSTRAYLSATARSGTALGAFLGGLARNGLDATLHSFGLGELIGRPPYEVLSSVVDHICGDGGLLSEAVARSAVVEVFAQVFDESDDEYADWRSHWDGQFNAQAVIDLMSLFLVQGIFQLFLSNLADRIETYAISATRAAQCEQEVLEFLKGMVAFEVGEIDPLRFDWRGPEGMALVQRNLDAAMGHLEAYV